MDGVWIWAAALATYGLFRAWYDNWRGPLSTAEVQGYLAELRGRGALAIQCTASFPTTPQYSVFGPRIVVALLLALGVALLT